MQKIIRVVFYLLVLLIPTIFTTINFELFEFPKFIALTSLTLGLTLAWVLHGARTHDWSIPRSPFNLAVLSFLVSQILATLLSIHPYTSFWGYYSRVHQGLATTICYTVIYFGFIKFMDKVSTQKIIKLSVSTAFAVSLYGIAERFGVDKDLWVQDVQSRVFSTLGQPNWLAAYIIPHIFLGFHLLLSRSLKRPILAYPLIGTYYLALLYSGSRSGFIAFVASLFVYWALIILNNKKIFLREAIISSVLIAVITIGVGSPYSPSVTNLVAKVRSLPVAAPSPTPITSSPADSPILISESSDIRKIVWQGALDLARLKPFIGNGVETFAYTYYWVRPLAHNYVSEWDFLYNKAHNEYLNLAANSGLLGLFTHLLMYVTTAYLTFKVLFAKKPNQPTPPDTLLHITVAASLLSIAITNFFGFSVIPVALLFYLLPALLVSKNQETVSPNRTPFPWFVVYTVLLFLVLSYPAQLFLADIAYKKGKDHLDRNAPSQALPYLEKAIELRPVEPLFYSTYAETTATLAILLNNQDETEIAKTLIDRTLTAARLTHQMNPWNLNFYKSRAKTYLTLATIDPSYNKLAADELETATHLAPTDPKLTYNLGLLYSRIGDSENTEKYLKKTIELKNNYESAYYALTLFYEEQKKVDLIPPLLEDAQTHLTTWSATMTDKFDRYLLLKN